MLRRKFLALFGIGGAAAVAMPEAIASSPKSLSERFIEQYNVRPPERVVVLTDDELEDVLMTMLSRRGLNPSDPDDPVWVCHHVIVDKLSKAGGYR